ncbi:MAG: DUF5915 domain-containing protein, partial [Candidatus Limnocylindrales bacterium]
APVSVHLQSYPRAKAALLDEQLLHDMALLRQVIELGRAARNKASLKVRQPLAELLVKVPNASDQPTLARLANQIQDELNVKAVRFVADLGDLVTYSVRGRPQLLGPKYQREAPKVMEAIKNANPMDVARAVQAGQPVTVTSEEIDVSALDRPGLSVAAEDNLAVAVTTTLTPELIQEGLARELVHRIQTMRKAADFRIEDRITTYFEAPRPLDAVFQRFGDYIKQETLSRDLRVGPGPADAYHELISLDGQQVALAVSR